MKKWMSIVLSIFVAFSCAIPISAEEEYSNEDYWYDKCSQPQDSDEGVNACVGFQEYQQGKWEELKSQINEYKDDLDSLEENADQIESLALKQKDLAEALSSQIGNIQAEIDAIQVQIDALEVEKVQKQEEIDDWKEQIEKRMQEEQVSSGTNVLIDLLMGASNLNEMFRRYNGIERITASDQDQIAVLDKLKQELDMKIQEQEQLSQRATQQKEQLETEQAFVKELENSLNVLETQYQKVAADLRQKMQEEAQMTAAITSGIISSSSGVSLPSVSGFASPIQGGGRSAGTWSYPGGGLHLGLDWATPIGTPLYAPADGVIIYAQNPVPSNNGYLGNWCGWPYGGGNTIEMLCQVNGTLYAISFVHLSNTFYVAAGSSVSQGQTIALTGNSGNTSGPHCHIEVYNLGSMSVSDAISRFSSSADFAWGTGWNTTATACESSGSTPCRERPERFFG